VVRHIVSWEAGRPSDWSLRHYNCMHFNRIYAHVCVSVSRVVRVSIFELSVRIALGDSRGLAGAQSVPAALTWFVFIRPSRAPARRDEPAWRLLEPGGSPCSAGSLDGSTSYSVAIRAVCDWESFCPGSVVLFGV